MSGLKSALALLQNRSLEHRLLTNARFTEGRDCGDSAKLNLAITELLASPDLTRHSFISKLLTLCEELDVNGEELRPFLQHFTTRATQVETPAGKAALQVAAYLFREGADLSERFVEAVLENESFLLVFEGKLAPDGVEKLQEYFKGKIAFEFLVRAGQRSDDSRVSSITVLEGKTRAKAKKVAPQPKVAAESRTPFLPADTEGLSRSLLTYKLGAPFAAKTNHEGILFVESEEHGLWISTTESKEWHSAEWCRTGIESLMPKTQVELAAAFAQPRCTESVVDDTEIDATSLCESNDAGALWDKAGAWAVLPLITVTECAVLVGGAGWVVSVGVVEAVTQQLQTDATGVLDLLESRCEGATQIEDVAPLWAVLGHDTVSLEEAKATVHWVFIPEKVYHDSKFLDWVGTNKKFDDYFEEAAAGFSPKGTYLYTVNRRNAKVGAKTAEDFAKAAQRAGFKGVTYNWKAHVMLPESVQPDDTVSLDEYRLDKVVPLWDVRMDAESGKELVQVLSRVPNDTDIVDRFALKGGRLKMAWRVIAKTAQDALAKVTRHLKRFEKDSHSAQNTTMRLVASAEITEPILVEVTDEMMENGVVAAQLTERYSEICDTPPEQEQAVAIRQKVMDCYIVKGNARLGSPTVVTQKTLAPGMYDAKMSMGGAYFEVADIENEELLRFEDSRSEEVTREVKTFSESREKYEAAKVPYKRGILLTGAPGNGKSCLLRQLSEQTVREGKIVLRVKEVGALEPCLKVLREIEEHRGVVCLLEDIDEMARYGERPLLQLLDGDSTMGGGICYLATTNYPERLNPRMMRAGRFDTIIEITAPPEEGRRAYFAHKLGLSEAEAAADAVTESDPLAEPLMEGIYDPHILKAVFMSGAPGAGKGFQADLLFAGTGLKVINSDTQFERAMKQAGLDPKTDVDTPEAQALRPKAKRQVVAKNMYSSESRLGLIIDGTARNPEKLLMQRKRLEQLGYDTSMVYVDTSLEVAQKRNLERPRVVSPKIVESSWKEVQKVKQKYKSMFGENFKEVDGDKVIGEELMKVLGPKMAAEGKRLLAKPLKNKLGWKWLVNATAGIENVSKVAHIGKVGKTKAAQLAGVKLQESDNPVLEALRAEVEDSVDLTAGFTFAEMKEFLIATRCLDADPEKAAARIRGDVTESIESVLIEPESDLESLEEAEFKVTVKRETRDVNTKDSSGEKTKVAVQGTTLNNLIFIYKTPPNPKYTPTIAALHIPSMLILFKVDAKVTNATKMKAAVTFVLSKHEKALRGKVSNLTPEVARTALKALSALKRGESMPTDETVDYTDTAGLGALLMEAEDKGKVVTRTIKYNHGGAVGEQEEEVKGRLYGGLIFVYLESESMAKGQPKVIAKQIKTGLNLFSFYKTETTRAKVAFAVRYMLSKHKKELAITSKGTLKNGSDFMRDFQEMQKLLYGGQDVRKSGFVESLFTEAEKEEPEDDGETDRMDAPLFYRDDMQQYYDMQVSNGHDEDEAVKRTKLKFKVKKLIVTPMGEVRSPGVIDAPSQEEPLDDPEADQEDQDAADQEAEDKAAEKEKEADKEADKKESIDEITTEELDVIQEFKEDLKQQMVIVVGAPASGKGYFVATTLGKFLKGDQAGLTKSFPRLTFGAKNLESDNSLRKEQFEAAKMDFKRLLRCNDKAQFDEKIKGKEFQYTADGKTVKLSSVLTWEEFDKRRSKFQDYFKKKGDPVNQYYASLRGNDSQDGEQLKKAARASFEDSVKYAIQKSGDLIVIDTAGEDIGSTPFEKFFKQAKDEGFTVSLVELNIPLEMSIRRNAKRGEGGRSVPDSQIKSAYNAISGIVAKLRQDKRLDRYVKYVWKATGDGIFAGYFAVGIDDRKTLKAKLAKFKELRDKLKSGKLTQVQYDAEKKKLVAEAVDFQTEMSRRFPIFAAMQI